MIDLMEARVGIEPAYTALQAVANSAIFQFFKRFSLSQERLVFAGFLPSKPLYIPSARNSLPHPTGGAA